MDGNDFNDINLMQVFAKAVANGAAGKPSVSLDVEDFLHLWDEMEASNEEKIELLLIIADIMDSFASMGFGVNPIQQACGKVAETSCDSAQADSEMLESEHSERKLE